MKIWKLLGLAVLTVTMLLLIGCGKAEEEPVAEPEPEAVEVLAAVDHVPTAEEIGSETTCVVCGMTMTVAEATPAAMYDGQAYFFCSAEEKVAFVADPVKHLTPPETPETTEAEGEGTH